MEQQPYREPDETNPTVIPPGTFPPRKRAPSFPGMSGAFDRLTESNMSLIKATRMLMALIGIAIFATGYTVWSMGNAQTATLDAIKSIVKQCYARDWR